MYHRHLKKIAFGAALASSVVFTSFAANAASYTIDLSHSFIEFRTKHLGYSWLSGRFNKFSGKLNYDPAAGAAGHEKQCDQGHGERAHGDSGSRARTGQGAVRVRGVGG